MAQFTRTARADADLIEIWRYIAGDNPQTADGLLDEIDDICRHLAEHPRMGPARPDLATGLRYFVVRRYLILYREVDDGILVVRVVHGARYLPDLI